MRTTPLVSATLLALAAQAASGADAATITLYSGDYESLAAGHIGMPAPGFALVRETLRADLQRGRNDVTRTDLPGSIDSATVRLQPTGAGVRIDGQRFDFALADQDELLRRSIGRRIVVTQAVGNGEQRHTGTLLAAGNGLTLALDTGAVQVLSNYVGFTLDRIPDGVSAKPTLRWTVDSERAANETLALDYATGGMAWRAEYLATLSGQGNTCRMDFDGAALIVNRSGASFSGASLSLVAGEPRLQRGGTVMPMAYDRAEMRMAAAPAAAPPEPQASGEYHAYTLPAQVDLPDGSVQRAPLLAAATGVNCERRYETRSPIDYYRRSSPIIDPDFGAAGVQPVQAMLAFTNSKAGGLGMPLPAGRLRVYERAGSGADAFLGEAAIGHTAAGRKVDVALGDSFDLSAERTRKDARLAEDRLSLSETVEVVVRNAKPSAVTVRVLETMPRWHDWEIVEASQTSERANAQTAAFEVKVPAAGETTLRYTVRYRWPESVERNL